jgi:hypothetical protein
MSMVSMLKDHAAEAEANREQARQAEAQKSLEQEISEMLADTEIPQTKHIPDSVGKFTDNVTKNFERTVIALRARAAELENAALELMDMADKLQSAAPYLTKEIHDWIDYERKCAERQMSLALVKPQPS